MRLSQKLNLRLSEIKQRLNVISGLTDDDFNDEIRAESEKLTSEYSDTELRWRIAEIAESDDDDAARLALNPDSEGRELRALLADSSIGRIFGATVDHRATDGREAEVQAHFQLGGNQIPLAMLRDPSVEERAVTAAPGDVGSTQAPIVPGVFPQSVAAFLGVDMPTVPVGDASFPVLTANAAVEALAEAGAGTESDGSFSGAALSPSRLQANFRFSIEDRAKFAGMGEALRANLSEALADGLDKQVIVGTEGLLTGIKLPNNNVNAVTTYALYRSQFAFGRVDGKYASTTDELRIVMGSGTYTHAAAQYRGNNDNQDALQSLREATGGVKVSAHVTLPAANKQNAIVRLGMRRDMVAALWEGVTLLEDPYTQKSKGEIVLTGVMLYAVMILRAGGFHKQQVQTA